MSQSAQEKRTALVGELTQEIRLCYGLGASLLRAAAARAGMTITDMQVIELLEHADSMTAGQLGELTGLTSGAITGMLNRLEEAGLVHRERDPGDGRRVIVQLVPGRAALPATILTSSGQVWQDLVADYTEEQLALVLDFLTRSAAVCRSELARLQTAPEGQVSSAPLGDLERGRLAVFSGLSRLTLRAEHSTANLYQACFEGTVPHVVARDGAVTIRYPRRLWLPNERSRAAEIALSTAIPWQITIQGGAAEIIAELGGLVLTGLEVKGGLSSILLELPTPSGTTPICISGGASDVNVRCPAGVAARVHLKGWASVFVFHDQTFNGMGNDVRLQTPDYDSNTRRYDIKVASSVSSVTITSA